MFYNISSALRAPQRLPSPTFNKAAADEQVPSCDAKVSTMICVYKMLDLLAFMPLHRDTEMAVIKMTERPLRALGSAGHRRVARGGAPTPTLPLRSAPVRVGYLT